MAAAIASSLRDLSLQRCDKLNKDQLRSSTDPVVGAVWRDALIAWEDALIAWETVEKRLVANRLAHAVLGQSLDELPPQTRRLLTAIHSWVTGEATRLCIPVELVRFTRRQLREALGFGDTQLKVHLR